MSTEDPYAAHRKFVADMVRERTLGLISKDTLRENLDFVVKDGGEREEFEGGMVRDTEAGKIDYTYVLTGPMLERWAEHLMKGAEKYERDNWTLACDEAAYQRYRRSAFRHLVAWLRDERDEDHAAAVIFNLNGAEYVRDKLA